MDLQVAALPLLLLLMLLLVVVVLGMLGLGPLAPLLLKEHPGAPWHVAPTPGQPLPA
jgi:hypothetical protein